MVVQLDVIKRFSLIGPDNIADVCFGMNVAHLDLGVALRHLIAHGVNQMRFSESNPAIQEQRVVPTAWIVRNLQCRGASKLIGFS